MGVCDVVADLAKAIERDLGPLQPRHALLAKLLAMGPSYLAAGDLGSWDEACVRWVDDPPTEKAGFALEDVFEFARHNMYGAFDVRWTRDEYEDLCRRLKSRGVAVVPGADVSDW
ncbi:MAG: hypothetical protein IT452_06855 [Planctomycetia bacterium]|nr:hypothetical protein [Planctomycetia bacterium]